MDETTTVERERKPVCEEILNIKRWLHCYFICDFYG